MVGVTCAIHGLRRAGCNDAGEPRAGPELQHGASLEEVPLEQDIVSQEQGTPPHLEGDGQGRTGDVRLRRDPSGPREVDRTYPPACQHPPGAWPWCALDKMEIKRERAAVKMGMDTTQRRSMASCTRSGMGTGVGHLASSRNTGCATSWEGHLSVILSVQAPGPPLREPGPSAPQPEDQGHNLSWLNLITQTHTAVFMFNNCFLELSP